MSKYITTPIYYVNGDPHVGHAYTSVIADIMKRAILMRGEDVLLTTGTDEHGQKNQEAAEGSGLATAAFLDRQSAKFRTLFDSLDVSYDHWVRTTSAGHAAAVEHVLRELHAAGLVKREHYSGPYCVGCEMFKRKADLDERGLCRDHQTQPVEMSEVNYFLRISVHQEWLRETIARRKDWIVPEIFKHEILNMLSEPLEDLCISRPKERVSLGIELPFDSDYVAYVWMDALVNYLSNLGWPASRDGLERWWPSSLHLMAKDIIKTHCIYWPILLKSLDIEPPGGFRVHGYWVAEGGVKMSKSLGNAVDPAQLVSTFGADSLRFYFARSMGHREASISERLVHDFHNVELVNSVGNLLTRATKLYRRDIGTPVVRPAEILPEHRELQHAFVDKAKESLSGDDIASIQVHATAVLSLAGELNRFFEREAPWKLAKDPAKRWRLESVLYSTLDCLRTMFELAWPIVPRTSEKALGSLGAKLPSGSGFRHVFAADGFPADAQLAEPVHLYSRV